MCTRSMPGGQSKLSAQSWRWATPRGRGAAVGRQARRAWRSAQCSNVKVSNVSTHFPALVLWQSFSKSASTKEKGRPDMKSFRGSPEAISLDKWRDDGGDVDEGVDEGDDDDVDDEDV